MNNYFSQKLAQLANNYEQSEKKDKKFKKLSLEKTEAKREKFLKRLSKLVNKDRYLMEDFFLKVNWKGKPEEIKEENGKKGS